MEDKKREALNRALEVVDCVFDSYNAWIESDDFKNLSAVVDRLLDLGDAFILDDKAREVVNLLRKVRDTSISLRRDQHNLNNKINP